MISFFLLFDWGDVTPSIFEDVGQYIFPDLRKMIPKTIIPICLSLKLPRNYSRMHFHDFCKTHQIALGEQGGLPRDKSI